MKQNVKIFLILIIIIGAVGLWFYISRFSTPESGIISRQGIHWHANLTIKINGEIQEIPENVGMVFQEMPIHTHAKDGVIHLEFTGLVRKDDIKLGRFFKI